MQVNYMTADLQLSEAQRTVLTLLGDAADGMRRVHALESTMRALVSSPLALAASAAVAGTQCPFDTPPEPIVGDFDANRNMYLHCLHATKHCWSLTGQSITCP